MLRRHPLLLLLAATAPVVLACSGTDLGRTINEVVPAVREIDQEYATEKVQCDTPIQTAPLKGCAIREISCGDVVEGNNMFGEKHFGDEFYVSKFCGVQKNHYDDATEAIYLLSVPSNVQADVVLTSDCADLDIASISVPPDATNRCPTISHSVQVCEMDQGRNGGSVRITTVDRAETHFVVVDGKDGQTGNFRLRVDCRNYR